MFLLSFALSVVGGAVASCQVHLSPDQAARVRSRAGTLWCVLGQDTLLSQCLSTLLELYSSKGGLSGR